MPQCAHLPNIATAPFTNSTALSASHRFPSLSFASFLSIAFLSPLPYTTFKTNLSKSFYFALERCIFSQLHNFALGLFTTSRLVTGTSLHNLPSFVHPLTHQYPVLAPLFNNSPLSKTEIVSSFLLFSPFPPVNSFPLQPNLLHFPFKTNVTRNTCS